MNDNYTYPAILDYSEEDNINIYFPDFKDAVTYADYNDDFVKLAQEYLALLITDHNDSMKELPKPSFNVEVKDNQKLIYINIWMPYFKTKVKEIYVKKTLTIPSWIDILAKNNGINFSSTLVNALKKELKID